MKVKIIKCNDSGYWYTNKIGEIFKVNEKLENINDKLKYITNDTVYSISNSTTHQGCIDTDDCVEILKTKTNLTYKTLNLRNDYNYENCS